jgi:CubicO group peptidase (beta-lactamase class C family)
VLLSFAATASLAQPAPQPTPQADPQQLASALARMSEAETLAALKTELARRAAADQFSGAVLIAKAGKPIFQHAYGYADREKKTPNTLDIKFRFGSMGKMFTAVSVMQLAQAGKLNLDDPVEWVAADARAANRLRRDEETPTPERP